MTSAAAMMIERLARSRPARESTRHSVPLDILVVDDDQATRLSLAYALADAGHRVVEAEDGEEAIALATERTFDVAVLDVRLPKIDGITIFRKLRTRAPRTAVILMTAFATIQDAVACLRDGAYDYVTKPFDPEELTLRVIGHISEHVSLKRELEEARRLVASRDAGSPIVGTTPVMTRLVELVNTIAQSDAPVLVQGETGTGKQLVAHTLHARSPRKSAPFVAFGCGAFPENRIDLELFGGYDGGRIRAADGGTLLLAEVDALPVTTQARLLRVLEEGVVQPVAGGDPFPVRVRIVSSTERDLKQLAKDGRFREDLLFRINVLDLQLPPLRERRADMPLLLAHFLRRFCPGRVPPGIGPRAWDSLMSYPFPGNVRELAQALERAVVLAHGSEIDVEHLPETIAANTAPEATLEPLSVATKDFEKRHVSRALSLTGGNVDRAAELLGVSPRTLRQKRERYGI
jgi:two-component system, NtrC family, response regulator AtoC